MFEPIEEKQNTPVQFLVYFVAVAAGLYWAGWVFAALWEWFILSVIPAKQITVPSAIGILLGVRLLFGENSPVPKNMTWELIQDRMTDWTLRPLVALTCGAIVNAFV